MDKMDRREKLLKDIRLEGQGLEIGPLCWPLLKKSEADIKYVDHVSTAVLKQLYKDDPGVDPTLIVDVDYPLNGRSLKKTVGKIDVFDYILASHVIEHVPDMVGWLQDLGAVLKVGGVLSLAIPDKRYTFDIDRNPSVPGEVVGAYIDNYNRPPSATVFDYASAYRLDIDAATVWSGEVYPSSAASHRYSLQQALAMCLENKKQYVDTHCFVFTPPSFFEIIRVLLELDLLDFKVLSFSATDENQYEFLVSLQKVDVKTSKQEQRLKSLPKLSREPHQRELEATITQQTEDIKKLKQALKQEQTALQHVLNSKSWRLTRPVRHGVRIVKRTRRKQPPA